MLILRAAIAAVVCAATLPYDEAYDEELERAWTLAVLYPPDNANATTCAQVGLTSDLQFGGSGGGGGVGTITNGDVTATVQTNSGSVQPGQGQEVNIAVLATISVDAVVVKGGNGYNIYKSPNVPPGLVPPQHYISPLNNGGNVPDISHWFICYSHTEPPPIPPGTGSIWVSKVVILPGGVIVTPPPTSYSATVDCGSAGTATVDLPGGGGAGTPNPALNGLTAGTSCTVQETTTLPPYVSVSYSPSATVTIVANTATQVTITNDFSNAPIQMGVLQLEKVVTNPGGASTPSDWTAQVTCNGIASPVVSTVTMPGSGGPGTPVLHPDVGAGCTVEELNVPAGWSVTYSVNGGPATSTPPTINVESTATFTVTITNQGPAPTPTPSPSVPGLPSTGAPPSGGGLPLAVMLLTGLVAALTAAAVVRARR